MHDGQTAYGEQRRAAVCRPAGFDCLAGLKVSSLPHVSEELNAHDQQSAAQKKTEPGARSHQVIQMEFYSPASRYTSVSL